MKTILGVSRIRVKTNAVIKAYIVERIWYFPNIKFYNLSMLIINTRILCIISAKIKMHRLCLTSRQRIRFFDEKLLYIILYITRLYHERSREL